jgi:hypothetical protein
MYNTFQKGGPMAGGTKNTTNHTRHLDNSPYQSGQLLLTSCRVVAQQRSRFGTCSELASESGNKRTQFLLLSLDSQLWSIMQNKPKIQLGGTYKRSLWVFFTKQSQICAICEPVPISNIPAYRGTFGNLWFLCLCKTKQNIRVFNLKTNFAEKTKPKWNPATMKNQTNPKLTEGKSSIAIATEDKPKFQSGWHL